MSAPVPVLLARLAGLLESARLENGAGNPLKVGSKLIEAQALLDVIRKEV